MLNERELASLRVAVEQTLPDTASILRRAMISDGQLGQIETWVTIALDIPCRVDENSEGRTVVIAASEASTGEAAIRLPYGTPIEETDRIAVTVNRRVRTFEIARIIESSYATVLTVEATEVR